jgi:predicted PurR-regulated permease PerM
MFIETTYIIGFILTAIFAVTSFLVINKTSSIINKQTSTINRLNDNLLNYYSKLETMDIELGLVKKELFKISSKKNSSLNSAKKLSLSIASQGE